MTLRKKYEERVVFDLSVIATDILSFWEEHDIFSRSVAEREGAPTFVFYEGPPSANGRPGIHHMMSRTIKDMFCRFKTLQGYQVKRKGGWDAHGLPVELQTEKQLGIVKEDVGKKISIATYNHKCRETVMSHKSQWDALTKKMGYWVDLENPYITYEKKYIESLWWILKQLYKKKLLYKGYSVQPYSPTTGTGLSSHELNLPGCYKEIKDVSVVAQFKLDNNEQSSFLYECCDANRAVYCLAWTTTPWTLPSNAALAVHAKIVYLLVHTTNPYTQKKIAVVLARDAFEKYFYVENVQSIRVGSASVKKEIIKGNKIATWNVVKELTGEQLIGLRYEPLLSYVEPKYDKERAFQIIDADFVNTQEGVGIVHIAPTYGSDDFKVAKRQGIPSITVWDENGNESPTVDRKGRFVEVIGEHLMRGIEKYNIKTHKPFNKNDFYVKNYIDEDESLPDYKSVDVILSIILKTENKAFRVEKYVHVYPHCWRTHKPVLYYPLHSWFIKTTAVKDRMVTLNRTINWKPPGTGEGRFGHWLENLVDWNLSRTRYWGTPLPIWRTKDGREEKCIGSIQELHEETLKASEKGLTNPDVQSKTFDLHRPYVDEVILISDSGEPMYRELDLVDVWFDSGAMPYAQHHYPFENQENFDKKFPADYVAEGVDQTRGWFFTLHAISTMLFDSVAFKNVISNGLLLDEQGNKMSKSKGNVVDPFDIIEKYGPDAVRWYMVVNAPPWENLKFDEQGIVEIKRKFFGTLTNTYSFFALYANIDGFVKDRIDDVIHTQKNYLDQWIISLLQSLIIQTTDAYNDYDATKAARVIQYFVDNHLSNWYVRLNRKRFWQPTRKERAGIDEDKQSAYETLHRCMITIAQLMSPIAPFFSEWLYQSLTKSIKCSDVSISVHLSQLNVPNHDKIDKQLERSMDYAQRISSLAHSVRKRNGIKVRTPIKSMCWFLTDRNYVGDMKKVEHIIKSEVNVKSILHIQDNDASLVVKKARPNYKKLGPKYKPQMKEVKRVIENLSLGEIELLEKGSLLYREGFEFDANDVIVYQADAPGWSMARDSEITVALDLSMSEDLRREGFARDFVNRIQNLRKVMHFEVTDKIAIAVADVDEPARQSLHQFRKYITTETQAIRLEVKNQNEIVTQYKELDIEGCVLKIHIQKT